MWERKDRYTCPVVPTLMPTLSDRPNIKGLNRKISRLQRWMIVSMLGLVSLWGLSYLALRLGNSRPDPFAGIIVWPAVEPAQSSMAVITRT